MTLLFTALAVALAYGLWAVKSTLSITTSVQETLSALQAPFASNGKNVVTHDALNFNRVVDANSGAGQDATGVAYAVVTLTAGAATINLAAIPGLSGVNQDLTGKRIRYMHLKADDANANPITVAKGASNGFTGFGASFSVTLDADRHAVVEGNQTQVASGVRVLDVTGTGTQKVEVLIVFGNN